MAGKLEIKVEYNFFNACASNIVPSGARFGNCVLLIDIKYSINDTVIDIKFTVTNNVKDLFREDNCMVYVMLFCHVE